MPVVKLSKIQKIFVVQQLAMFDKPVVVIEALKEKFGVTVTIPAITHYSPDTNPNLKKNWKELFDQTRAEFLENVSAIPIANKAVRLRALDRLYDRQSRLPENRQNPVEIRATLEQAAKESGGQYTNRTEHSAPGGKPLIPDAASAVVLYLPDNGRGDAGPAVDPNAETGVNDKK